MERRSMMNDLNQIVEMIRELKLSGKSIVFTNGCFDILHRGHVAYLQSAKDMGDILIVGMNTDASVKRLKGNDRPVNTLEDRAFVLSALKSVDYVIPFDEDTPLILIQSIHPDILVKGGDYTLDTIIGAKEVLAHGGKVEVIPFVEGKSTTSIIDAIKRV
ncbi:MAG: D-glycero-beta-D-manno-heptose 1-phosphate adenylyltransferase [Ignavibacteria bacterium]|nr:D-glycero-beta-D-manno-heptose 1-phosphate adenylyltransferase [Ignavibacteria bacterium]